MAGKIARAGSLMKASWRIVKSDKSLLLFPLFSTISLILVGASFVVPIILSPELQHALPSKDGHDGQQGSIAGYAFIFVFYFCNYFIITFFNSGLVFCASRSLQGEKTSFKAGVREAAKHIHHILGWALIASSVGLILRSIEERSGLVGKIVAAIIGIAFSVANYLVVPIMILENKGPVEALKESSLLLQKTWGKRILSNIGFSLIFMLLLLPPVVLLIIGAMAVPPIAIVMFVILPIYVVMLLLVQSTIYTVFQTVLYDYTRTGTVPIGFNQEYVAAAFKQKKSKKNK